MQDDGALHHSFRATGEIEISLPSGAVARLTGLFLEREGELRDATGALELTLTGPLGEVRKLRELGPAVAEVIAYADEHPDAQTGEILLRAHASLLEDLARALPPDALTLADALDEERWAAFAFSFDRYDALAMSVVTAEETFSDP